MKGPRLFRTDARNQSTGRSWQKAVGDVLESRFVLLRKEVEYQDTPIAPEAEEPPPAEAAPADSTEKTWIEVRVEDEDGNPIRNTRYELKRPTVQCTEAKPTTMAASTTTTSPRQARVKLTLPGLQKPSASA